MEAIETLYADRLAEHIERLAHHALRGEVWDKAVSYCYQAGAQGRGEVRARRRGGAVHRGAQRRSSACRRAAR